MEIMHYVLLAKKLQSIITLSVKLSSPFTRCSLFPCQMSSLAYLLYT